MREIQGLQDVQFQRDASRLVAISREIKRLEAEQKQLRDEVLGGLVQAEVKSCPIDDAVVTIVEGKSPSKFDKEKLRLLLVQEGMEVVKVVELFDAVTTPGKPWTSVSVKEGKAAAGAMGEVEGVAV